MGVLSTQLFMSKAVKLLTCHSRRLIPSAGLRVKVSQIYPLIKTANILDSVRDVRLNEDTVYNMLLLNVLSVKMPASIGLLPYLHFLSRNIFPLDCSESHILSTTGLMYFLTHTHTRKIYAT